MPSPSHSEQQSSTELRLRQELIAQARFLDGLVESLGAVSSTLGGTAVLERTAREAQRLFEADAAVVLTPAAGARTLRPAASAGLALGPLADVSVSLADEASAIAAAARDLAPAVAAAGESPADELTRRLQPASLLAAPLVAAGRLHALLVLLDLGSGRGFGPADLGQAAVFADFAARAAENGALFERVEALLAQARIREAERAELSRRVVSAEQEERRRLSTFLHDGPVQTLSGVTMMLDAVAEAIADGDAEAALKVLETARDRQRSVIGSVRELSFALEPWTLRDQGFETALRAIADRFEADHRVTVRLDVADAEQLTQDDQVVLFQIVREAMTNALKHASPTTIEVSVHGSPQEGLEARVADDGTGIVKEPDDGLPHHGMASMQERAAILNGRLDVDAVPGTGTTVRVLVAAGRLRSADG
ncbi:MAG TPA: GAF domain-containing sensor histidine kinase [Gaiellales bacterium]|jgi:signal transduction histidine kinase|nr:GAF domain-containing sensor histidine kinase [Gaiellales bacterium]